MSNVNLPARLLLSCVGIFLVIVSAFVVLETLYSPLALPITIGISSIILALLVHRWYADLYKRNHDLERRIHALHRALSRQEAVINVMPMLGGVFVPLGPWAMEPTHLFNLLGWLLPVDARVVVECGAGASTLAIGNLLRQKGRGHIYSFEEDPKWYEVISRQVDAQDLNRYVTVVWAPLEPYAVNRAETVEWYAMDQVNTVLSAIDLIDLLIVDGPKSVRPLSRFPALPVFHSKCNAETLIVLDDVNRSQEQLVLSKWQDTCTLEVDIHQDADRHQAHIRIRDNEPNRQRNTVLT